jgi:putative acetyltransferase
MTIREALSADRDALLDIWLRSVRATHPFLTEADIPSLLPLVRDSAPAALELWVRCAGGEPVGFLGLSGASVEAMFTTPEWCRQGGGRMLLDPARRLKGPLTVSVNEQNPGATRFDAACGFSVVGRSEVDDGGRPFPLLHRREIPTQTNVTHISETVP